jgi:hypothetical protein
MTQYQHIAIQQSSKLLPGRFEFLCLLLAHQPTALRHQRQSTGRLHAWLGGVVPTCFSFSSLLCLGAHILCGPAAALSCINASPLRLNSGAGRRWSGRGISVAAGSCGTIVCVPTECSSVSNGVTEVDFNKKMSNTHWLGRISRGKQLRHIRHGIHVQ